MIRWLLLYAAAVKAFDGFWDGTWASGCLWLFALAVAVVSERAGYAVMALVGFGSILVGFTASGHVATIAWLALAAALFVDRDRWTALRALAIAIYLFTGLNKLLFGFLGGGIIVTHGPPWIDDLPVSPSALAVAATCLELWLAWAVWRRSPTVLPVALALHGGILLWMWPQAVDELLIASLFQILLVSLAGISVLGGGQTQAEPSHVSIVTSVQGRGLTAPNE